MSEYISTKENPNGDIMPVDIGKYTNLHAHSVFSPLDGFGKLEEYCERVKALGMRGLCLSEHGNMFGHHEQAAICKKHGIKPIFANEGYMTLHSGSIKEKIEGYKANYHILLIAINNVGYKNLMKATSIAWTRYKYYKPRFDLALLEECSEGIICTSACLGGPINQLYLDGKPEEAEQVALRLKSIFGDRFYLEKTYTGLEEQDIANKNLSEISRKHNIPMIITCDSHYVYPWQSDDHAKLVLVNTGGQLNKKAKDVALTDTDKDDSDVDNNSMFYQPSQYYVKPWHVLHDEYYNTEEDQIAFENTNKIADMCNVTLEKSDDIIYPQPYEDPDAVLKVKAMQWYDTYTKDFTDEKKKEYLDRLNEEMVMYEKMGFSSYPLVLQEILENARSKGIMTGPGRGCICGSTLIKCRTLYLDYKAPIYKNSIGFKRETVPLSVYLDYIENKNSMPNVIGHGKQIQYIPIENLGVNNSWKNVSVLNHNGKWVEINRFCKYEINGEPLVSISGVVSTLDHMHYTLVRDKEDPNKDDWKWIQAKDLEIGDLLKEKILNPKLNEYYDSFGHKVTDKKIITNHNYKYVYDLTVNNGHSYTVAYQDDDLNIHSFITHNSAAGSLLSYALGITAIDPIPYGLLFSRYLNAGRAKIPLIEFEGYPIEEWNYEE